MSIDEFSPQPRKTPRFLPIHPIPVFAKSCLALALSLGAPMSEGANPVIDYGATTAIDYNENSTANVLEVAITDADMHTIDSVQLVGVDAGLFNLTYDAGQDEWHLTFITTPNFEQDKTINLVSIKATDSNAESTTVDFTITIKDQNEAPGITSPDTQSRPETETVNHGGVTIINVTTEVAATAFSLSGDDAGFFDIDASGVLTLKSSSQLDYDNPLDTNQDNAYDFVITASNISDSSTQNFTFNVLNVNEAPVITQPSETILTINENTTAVAGVDASDPDLETLTLTHEGTDADLFTLNGATGALAFLTAPDYESPQDADGDNIYEVTVVARDSSQSEGSIDLKVIVANKNDPPAFTFNTTSTLVTDTGGGAIQVDGYETRENGDSEFEFSTLKLSNITLSDDDFSGSGLPSPQVWLKFDETSGTAIADSSGNGHLVTFLGGNATPVWEAALFDNGLHLNDNNQSIDYIEISDLSALQPGTDSYSISFWFKPDDFDSTMTLVSKGMPIGLTGSDEGFISFINTDSSTYFRIADGVPNVAHANIPTIDTSWHHYVGIIDRYTDSLYLYIDNTLYAQNANAPANTSDLTTVQTIDNTDSIIIGRDTDSINYFQGVLDDFRIYNSPLSPSQVEELYSSTTAQTVTVSLQVSKGALTLGDPSNAGLSYSVGDGTADTSMIFSATVEDATTAMEGMVFTPTDEITGTDNFLYHITDSDDNGVEVLSSQATLNIQEVNDNPVNIVPGTQSINEGDTLQFRSGSGNGVSINDDSGGNDIEVTLSVTTGSGTLTIGTAGLVFSIGDGTADETMTFQGTLSEANTALGTLDYTPATDFNGTTTFTIYTNDLGNTGLDDLVTIDPAQSSAHGSDTDTVTINISTQNDPVSLTAIDASIEENETAIYQVGVSDPDLNDDPLTEVITYSITGGDDSSFFTLASDGTLSFTNSLDFETPQDADGNNTYLVTIKVRDSAGNEDENTFTYTITDVNETPIITSPPDNTSVEVPENSSPTLATIAYTDPEGENVGAGTLALTLSGNDSALFSLDANTGILTFLASPDFETPLDADADNVYEVSVVATDSAAPTPNTDTLNLTVNVTDDNDTPSIVLDDTASNITDAGGGTYTVDGFETRTAGTPGFVFSTANSSAITINDPDYDSSGLPSPALWIKLDETSGTTITDSSANNITTTLQGGNSNPDWTSGTDATHNRDFNALDLNGTTDYILVNDATVLRPAADSYTLSFWIKADSTSGSQPLFAKGTDLSSPVATQGFLVYLLTGDVVARAADGTDIAHAFSAITTDWHHVATVLDRNQSRLTLYLDGVANHQQTGYNGSNLTDLDDLGAINSTDSIELGYDGSIRFAGILDDVRVYNSPLNASQVTEIYNSNTPGSLSLTLSVSNGTLTLGNPSTDGLSYTAGDGTADASMTITGSASAINAALDGMAYTPTDGFNGNDTLSLSLTDTDANGTESASASYTLNVQAINRAPVITLPSGQSLDEASSITFSTANANTLTITDDATENPGTESIQVTLTALAGSGVLTLGSTAGLSITSGDGTQDPAITFTSTLADANTALDGLVFSLVAVEGGNADFNGTATIDVQVNDQGNFGADDIASADPAQTTQQETTTETLSITVNPINDAFTINESVVSMDENSTTAVSLTLSDPDLSDNPLVEDHTFSIISGADMDLFTIDADTGVVSFLAAPDFENPQDDGANNVYDITVQAVDSGNLTDTQAISITVDDVNDAPTFTTTTTDYFPQENQTTVATFAASDQDAGQTVQYSIVPSTYSPLFAIDANSGALTFLVAPDFENPSYNDPDTSFQIDLQATDDAGSPLTSDPFSITVTVSNENESPSITNDPTVTMDEEGTTVVTITVTDPDAGDTFTYSVVGGDDQGLFTADTNTGVLSFAAAPSFEVPLGGISDDSNTYDVTVRATDAGGLTADHNLDITIEDINDAPTFTIASPSVTADENQNAAITLTATDEDLPSSNFYSQLEFSITAGPDDTKLILSTSDTDPSSATATLTFSPTPDFENPGDTGADGTYDLTAQVSDTVNDVQQALAITINNVNDAPVYSVFPTSQVVDEDTALAFGPGTNNAITVSDEDIQADGDDTLQLTILVDGGNGSLNVTGIAGLVHSGNGTENLVLTANPDTLNTALESLTFTGSQDYHGSETLRFIIDDQGSNLGAELTTEQTIIVTINAINDAPSATFPVGSPNTDEDTSYTFSIGTATQITVADVDNPDDTQVITVSIFVPDTDLDGAADGTLQLASSTNLDFIQGNGLSPHTSLIFSGSIADINTALDGMIFDLADNFNGTAQIQLVAADTNLSDQVTWSLTVDPLNDSPVISLPNPQNLEEDGNIYFQNEANVAQVDELTFVSGQPGDAFTFTLGSESIEVAYDTTPIITATNFVTAYNASPDLPPLASVTHPGNGVVTLTAITPGTPYTATIERTAGSSGVAIATINNQTPNRTFNNISVSDDASEDSSELRTTLSVSNGVLQFAAAPNVTFDATAGGTFEQATGSGANLFVFTGTVDDTNQALKFLQYIPNANFNGTDSLSIIVDDQGNHGDGSSFLSSDNLTLVVNAVNDGPSITAPVLSQPIDEDTNLTFNDSNSNRISVTDPDAAEVNGELLVTLTAQYGKVSLSGITGLTPVSGSLPTGSNMSFTGLEADINIALDNLQYIPNSNHNRNIDAEAITISLSDQGNNGDEAITVSKVVNIDIAPVNDAPSILILDLVPEIDEESTYVFSSSNQTAITLSDDAFEADQELRVTLTAANGTFTLATTAGLTMEGLNGTQSFSFTGTQAELQTALDGLTYAPAAGDGFGFSGTDTLTFLVQDLGNEGSGGFLEATVTVNITVNPVNDQPIHYFNWQTFPTTQTATEDQDFIFSTPNGNSITVADDASEAGFEIQTTLSVSKGTLTLGDTTGLFLFFSQGDGNADPFFTMQGTVDDINAALDGLIFSPQADSNDDVIISITTNDLNNTGSGGALSDTDLIPITVDAVNDAPSLTAPSGTLTTIEDNPFTFTAGNLFVIADDASEAALPVSLSVSALNGTVTLGIAEDNWASNGITLLSGVNGSSALAVSGEVNNLNLALNGLVYSPNPDYVGTDTVSVLVEDLGNNGSGSALSVSGTASVQVDAVNDAPLLNIPGDQIVFEDSQISFSNATLNPIIVSDADTYALSSSLAVTLTLQDEFGETANNRGTLTLDKRDNLFFTIGDGVDDFTMSFQGSLDETNSSLDGLVFMPADDYSGEVHLKITIDDQGNTGVGGDLSVEGSIKIDIGPTNDTPVILMPSSLVVNEDGQLLLSGTSIQVFDDAAQSDQLKVNIQSENGTIALGSTSGLEVTSTSTSHEFYATLAQMATAFDGVTFSPNSDYNGDASLTITVNDEGAGGQGAIGADTQVLSITVNSINDVPSITLPDPPTVREDESVTFGSQHPAGAITVSDIDAGTGELEITLETSDGFLSVGSTAGLNFVEGDGHSDSRIVFRATLDDTNNNALTNFVFTPGPNPDPTGQILFIVNDQGNTGAGGTLSSTSTLAINVDKLPPVIDQGESRTVTMKDNLASSWIPPTLTATDPNNEVLTWSLHSGATSGAVTVTGTGQHPDITYVPNENFIGQDAFIVRVTDASGNTDTILINVIVNAPPAITTSPSTEHKLGNYEYAISVNDADAEDVITISAVELPSGLTLSDNGNRTASLSGTFANPGSVNPWSDAVPIATGWFQNWFGVFHNPGDSSGWVYSAEHGWIYSQSTDPANFWFWNERLGWTWTSRKQDFRIVIEATDGHNPVTQDFIVTVGVYPTMYSHDGNSWLYYEEGTIPSQFWFYNESRWVTSIYSFNVNATASGATSGGTITGAGKYDLFSSATLTATPDENHNFLGWSGDIISSENTISIPSITQDVNLFAEFEEKIFHDVNVVLDDDTGTLVSGSPDVHVSGAGSYELNTTASLTITYSSWYIFEGWSGDTAAIGLTGDALLQETITFPVDQPYNLQANFRFDFDEWERLNPQ